jgi:UDP-N-acetyl-D-mannosaminuronic acid dehydrogenase
MNKICVIGLGRVGLPLALSLEEIGFDIQGIEIDIKIINKLKNKKMPFKEKYFDKLLENSKMQISDVVNNNSDVFIITVGTPLMQHIEIDLKYIQSVIDNLIENNCIYKKLIILRSTVAPKTTEYIKNYIENETSYICGKDFYLTVCPERIVEGDAYNELKQLPQLIGHEDKDSYTLAYNIFSKLTLKIFKCSFIEAELSKLFCNIYRYINFAIPNYFTYISNFFKVDIFNILKLMNTDYPRNNGLKAPGITSGSCLRKDFGLINESFPTADILLQTYKIHEFMPKFYSNLISLKDKNVGILGYTMKKDSDDTRDSLIPKLIRYIERENCKKIMLHEPNLSIGLFNDEKNNKNIFTNYNLCDIIKNTEIIFIAINHSEFYNLNIDIFKGKSVIDIWGILKRNLINYF